jgi:sec-independent protein translocase protein TatA
MRQLKDATEDIKKEIYKTAEKNGVDTSITQDIQKEIDEVKKSITEVPGSMKRNF